MNAPLYTTEILRLAASLKEPRQLQREDGRAEVRSPTCGSRIETVVTRWGDVRVKLRGWRGRVIDAAPEYDDCLRLARESDLPIRDIWNEAHRMAEAFIGRRLDEQGNLC